MPTSGEVADGVEEQAITLVEEMAAIQAGTTGLRTWTAAQVNSPTHRATANEGRLHIAHHILSDPRLLRPAQNSGSLPPVLELGAGTGFLSILLAKLGGDVVSTDLGGQETEDMETTRRTPLARLQQNVNLSQ